MYVFERFVVLLGSNLPPQITLSVRVSVRSSVCPFAILVSLLELLIFHGELVLIENYILRRTLSTGKSKNYFARKDYD